MRFTEIEIEDIKRNQRLDSLLPSFGFELYKHGNDLKILCPFHDDKNPSLIITPEKNLWHCMACNEGGSVIDFLMKYRKLSFLDACIQLKPSGDTEQTVTSLKPDVKHMTYRGKPVPRAKLLERVTAFYQKALKDDQRGLEYLKSRGITDPDIFENFRIGFCNGTLFKAIPENGEIIEQLKSIGILQDNNRESFEDCIIFPILNPSGMVMTLYGRKINESGTIKHLYLSGSRYGLVNGHALKSYPEIIMTESIIDGLSLYQAGVRNVVPCYGVNGFNSYFLEEFKTNKVKDVFILFDNDEAGRDGALTLKKHLQEHLINAEIIDFSEEKDINDYLVKNGTEKLFSVFTAKKEKISSKPSTENLKVEHIEGLLLEYSDRKYFIKGVETTVNRLRANIKAQNCTRFHIDTFDLYSAKARKSFIREASALFKQDETIIEGDIASLIGSVEQYSRNQQIEGLSKEIMSDKERTEALSFGKTPDLMEKILKDFESLGYIGEQNNKTLCYLGMTSRRLRDPLSVMILSASGAGKSALQDTTLSFCPEEDLIKLTTLTERALFYKDPNSLQNKVLALAEEAGGVDAGYAIRNLISNKELTIEATVKDPMTGRMTTMTNTVKGPTAVFKTTTNPDTDAETRSRFIILAVDESIDQTRRVLAYQREMQTLEGFIYGQKKEAIIRKHRNFQRLLRPVAVFNPFAKLLTYEEKKLWVRRDHPKYLQLINAIAFLHQLQRPLKRKNGIEYIDVTLEDISLANELAGEIFCRSLDDLSSPGRRLLEIIDELVKGRDPARFTRREIREACGWGETYVRRILTELVRMEHLVIVCGAIRKTFSYELISHKESAKTDFMHGLANVEALREKADRLNLRTSSHS